MIRLRFIFFLVIFLIVTTSISSGAEGESREHINEGVGLAHFHIPFMTYSPSLTNCRYGINLSWSRGGEWIPVLGVGHYIIFSAKQKDAYVPETTEFFPQVRLEQVKEDGEYLPRAIITPPLPMDEGGLGPVVLANPGQL